MRVTQFDVLCHAEMIGDLVQDQNLALHYLRIAVGADFCVPFGFLLPIGQSSGPLPLGKAAQDEGKGAGQEAGDGRHDQRPAGHVVIEQRMHALQHSCQRSDAGQQADDSERGEDDEGTGPMLWFHASLRVERIGIALLFITA